MQREEPRPAIGTFEARRHRPVQKGKLARDLIRHEHRIGARADLGRNGQIGIEARKAKDLPPTMDAAMPVETAVKDRVMLARGPCVLRPVQHQVHLVGIFAAEMRQGRGGKTDGVVGGEVGHYRNFSIRLC